MSPLLGLSGRTLTSRDFREPRERPKLWEEDERDFNVTLGSKAIVGDTGKGKGVLGAFILTEFLDRPPTALGKVKVVAFDTIGRMELGCAGVKMRPENPLYRYLVNQRNDLPDGEEERFEDPDGTTHPGVNPRAYKVEVRTPLSWFFDKPALEYSQPEIVKPYVLAIDDLLSTDWSAMLGLSEDHRASFLHGEVIKRGIREGWLATATAERLAAEADALTRRKRKGERRLYTQKQMQTLGNLYGRLGAERIVMPKHPAWDAERELPWLDMKATLEDAETITVFPLDFAVSKSQAAHLMAVLLNRIKNLKDKNNPHRVQNPVVIYVPDASTVAPPSFNATDERFMKPMKELLLWFASKGTGSQICLITDMQMFGDVDDGITGKATTLAVFKSERDEIQKAFRNLSVENKDEMLEQETLRRLERPGTFLLKTPGDPEVRLVFGAIPRFEYPRHALGNLSDFSYVDLWRMTYPKSSHPERWHDIQPLYKLVEGVRKNAENEWQAGLAEDDEEGKPAGPALDFGSQGNLRVARLLEETKGRGSAVVGLSDLAGILGDSIPQGPSNVRTAHARKIVVKLEKKGFAHLEPESFDGRRMWKIEVGRLRKALEKQAEPEGAEAAKKVAELGQQAISLYVDGDEAGAAKVLGEMVGLASAHKDSKDVRAVMIGFMGHAEQVSALLELAPALKALAEGEG